MARIKIGDEYVNFRGKIAAKIKTLTWKRREEGFRDFTEFDRWLKKFRAAKGGM